MVQAAFYFCTAFFGRRFFPVNLLKRGCRLEEGLTDQANPANVHFVSRATDTLEGARRRGEEGRRGLGGRVALIGSHGELRVRCECNHAVNGGEGGNFTDDAT